MEDKNRQKAIELALASIEKEYGKGSIMRLKDGESMAQGIEVVSSGSIGLDIDETAAALSLSTATVKRDWRVARAWLAHTLKSGTTS